MEGFLGDIIGALLPQSDIVLYVFLFISAIVENLFPPVPGDTITAFGAFLVGSGRLDFVLVYLSTTSGSVIGFMCLYFVGRLAEREFFIARNYRFFSAESIISAERWFGRYGYFVVLGNRFLPGIRSVISVVSGISELGALRVVILATASAMVWNLIWIYTGYTLGSNWDLVREKASSLMRGYNIAAGILLLSVVVFFLVKKRLSRKNNP